MIKGGTDPNNSFVVDRIVTVGNNSLFYKNSHDKKFSQVELPIANVSAEGVTPSGRVSL